MSELILGVDGGGSKTKALVADAASGRVLGAGLGGSSNYHAVGLEHAGASILEAVAGARAAAGLDPAAARPFRAACLGLAGMDRPSDSALIHGWLRDKALAERIRLVSDVELVLAAGAAEGWGVALICGTGSIAFGRSSEGRTARAGGWGFILGDEGSGYSIAIQALKLATQTVDDRADAPAILQAVLEHWNLREPSQLLGTVYRPDLQVAEIAGLARRILALADDGDLPARRLLDHAAVALGRLVDAVIERLDLVRPPIALAGGVLRSSALLREAVLQYTSEPLGPETVVQDPAEGALVLAGRAA